jgi:hypothetical protein
MTPYDDILWMPVDFPKFPRPDFRWDSEFTWNDWHVVKLVEDVDDYGVTNFRQDMRERYPDIIEWIEQFPYKTIRGAKLNIQINDAEPHKDFIRPHVEPNLYQNNQENEPCGYRVLIAGNRTDSLYVEHEDKRWYPSMPEDTDVYLIGHTTTYHGVEQETDRRTMFLHFEIEPEEHKKLVDRSLLKYKDYIITKDN